MSNKSRQTANLVSDNGLSSVDGNIGIGTTNPVTKLNVVGIVSATSFYGDGSNLTGIIASTAGVSTYASNAGIATYATTAGIATNATTAGTATTATNIDISATSSGDTTAYVVLVGDNTTGGQQPFIDNGSLTYNASTNVLTAGGGFSGDGSALTSLNGSQITSGTIPGDRGVTSGSTSSSFIEYNGTTATSGQFDGGTTTPSGTTRLNYGGYLYATRFYGDGSQLSGIQGGIGISTNTTNQAQYIPYATSFGSTTGVGATTLLVYNPSTSSLGIGTTNPRAPLDVTDSILVSTGVGQTYDTLFKVYDNELGALSFEDIDSANQYFSITKDNSSTLFAVNDPNGVTKFIVGAGGSVGIGTENPVAKLHVIGDAKVGVDTSQGIILTSPNSTQYRLIVDDSGNLSTTAV